MRKLLLIFLTLSLAVETGATGTLTAASRIELLRQGRVACRDAAPTRLSGSFRAFISVDDDGTVASLRRQGVKIRATLNGYVIADIPADMLDLAIALPGVRHISLARPLQLCNDSARICSNVDPLHTTTNRIVPIMGKGVIIGMIDTGIDFNHINLCDNEGRTRVRAVYMPLDSTGISPVVHGDTLPGSSYELPEQIAALTTDYEGSSHGTHTAGTAAGAFRGNGWHGVALESDLVLCGIPADELTDANIASSIIYIFDYADRVGKPCVVNMSISSNEGPNDGSSYLCRLFEDLTGPGRICVVAAGNDGNAPICFHSSIGGGNDTVTTLLRNQWGGLQRKGYVSMWSDASQQHRTRLVVINRSSGMLEYASPFLDLLPDDSVYTVSSEMDPDFARYYEGEVNFANAFEPRYDESGHLMQDGRFHSYWLFDATSVQAGHLLGLQYVADEHVELSGWCTKGCYFYTFGLDGVTGGEKAGSISDLATTDSVISVGAFCSRSSYVAKTGEIVTFANCDPGDVAYFSSFGPDERGVGRPDICAPGLALMSSANRYDTNASQDQWPASVVLDGQQYPYYANQGTSMSAPMVAGTVALMLQVYNGLGPADVRTALQHSARSDSYVNNGDQARWGAGKLDADAAVEDIISRYLMPGDVNNDHEVNIADINALIDIILSGGTSADAMTMLRADVNHDSEIRIADINNVIDLILSNL